jgi:hypothetical protein
MRRRSGTLAALAVYSLLAIALTWPLARGLTRDLPADLVDPLLNTWIVARNADQLLHALAGHPGALREYWNAPIFFPHPLALAYSEHLTAQALEILPVYAISRNPILCYDLLFLSTFALSAFGMFLFVRELTGDRLAAFLAGLAFGFAPYRMGSLAHVQVLSSAWMPLALYAFRRFFATRRLAPLVGGAAAWLAQNLSCGYYLLFFSPVVALYLAWEITVRRLWRDGRTVAQAAGAIAAVAAATLPFLLPYLDLRRLGFRPRTIDETRKFSADVYGYFTADVHLRVWGALARAWTSPEGSVFQGLIVVVLTSAAIAYAWKSARCDVDGSPSTGTRAAGWTLAAAVMIAAALLLGWTIRIPSTHPIIKITELDRELAVAAALTLGLLVGSPYARAIARRVLASPIAFLLAMTVLAVAMSFGPVILARGRIVEEGTLYAICYRALPGFDGLRVPARFAMIVAFGLAALAGCGAAAIGRRARGRGLVWAACALIVVEGFAVPIPINANDTNYRQTHLAPLPDTLTQGGVPPPAYTFAAQLPASSVLLELPLGEPAFDVRYMFHALTHGHPLVNGYSGGAPENYFLLGETLKDFATAPDRAWRAIETSGATHVIVHEDGYEPGRGQQITSWLTAQGARTIGVFGSDRVLAVSE